MKIIYAAVPETDPSWNTEMETWWSSGGALLWNRFGGSGSETLELSEEEEQGFLDQASRIEGWNSGPVIRNSTSETEFQSEHIDAPPMPPAQHGPRLCCRECGRRMHESLAETRSDKIVLDVQNINHVLNSLAEAVEYAKGKGPNNYRTWEAVLDSFLESIRRT